MQPDVIFNLMVGVDKTGVKRGRYQSSHCSGVPCLWDLSVSPLLRHPYVPVDFFRKVPTSEAEYLLEYTQKPPLFSWKMT